MSLISLTTLAILPALVPILAPLLALANDAASACSVCCCCCVSDSAPSPLWSPRILLQIGSISVIRDKVETASSQKKNELAYPYYPMEARVSSIKNKTRATDVMIVK